MSEGRKVYNRLETVGEDRQAGRRRVSAARAPMLVPLMIGFLLLLGLVLALGIFSSRELNNVSNEVLDLQRRRGNQLRLLLDLRIVLTELNNEARARAEAEARGGLLPPFALRRRNAVARVREVRELFMSAPLAATEEGQRFLSDLEDFVAISESMQQYTLKGFESFRTVGAQLDSFIQDATREQQNILIQTEELQNKADRRIRFWMMLTILAGTCVAVGTIWEVQRRFRQLQSSLYDVRREREFSTQVLEGMPTAVATLDSRNALRGANQSFLRIFPQARIGASPLDECDAPEACRMLESVTAAEARAAAYRGRWQLQTGGDGAAEIAGRLETAKSAETAKSGETARSAARDTYAQTFDAYVSPVKLGDEDGMILTLVDVTEAIAAEQALRRQASLAAVGQAAAQVAHEIKNPLGSIRLGVSLLRETTTDDDSLSTIKLIERGIEHLNKLTVDVTQYSRATALELAPVEINELLDSSLELVRDRVAEKRIRIERHYEEESLPGSADADQLRQVFVNLIANAIDASREGAPITISTKACRRDTAELKQINDCRTRLAHISIADCGGGMDERTREHLFEPFFTTKKHGTGLGLAISKKIIEQHNGKIEVESKAGEGTTFRIQLPI